MVNQWKIETDNLCDPANTTIMLNGNPIPGVSTWSVQSMSDPEGPATYLLLSIPIVEGNTIEVDTTRKQLVDATVIEAQSGKNINVTEITRKE